MLSIMSHELPHHASSVTLQGKSFLSFTEPVSLQKSSHASASINPVDGGCHFFPVPNYIDPVAYIDSALNRRNSEQCTKQEEPMSRDSAASVADFKLSREGQNYGQYRDMGAVYIGGSNSKDRHSKVITAKGARDRRIRLSVETAIRLFHVQDMLGFQHPSQAVEWLICTCQAAIEQLPPGLSESLMPAFFPPPIIYPPNSAEAVSGAVRSKGRITKCKKKAKAGGIAKPQESHRRFVITDDRRQKARERARERTKCKLQTSQTQNPCIGEQRYQPSVFQNEEKPNYCSNPFDLSEISVLSNCNYRKDPKEKYHICAQEETSALDEELNYVLLW